MFYKAFSSSALAALGVLGRAWTTKADADAIRKPRVTIVEPAWGGHVHLPANLGFLRTVLGAYPQTSISCVADQTQIDLMRPMLPLHELQRVQFLPWMVEQKSVTSLADVTSQIKRLRGLPSVVLEADLFVMSSITAPCMAALTILGKASRCVGMLHGNAGDLTGWRSRNPWFRTLDFRDAAEFYVAGGGRLLVMEPRIATQLGQALPQLRHALATLPHPLIEEEARPAIEVPVVRRPVKIGFAGLATREKGFVHFLELANRMNASRPGSFEFHAYGKLGPRLGEVDQTALAHHAGAALDRASFLSGIRHMDYLFLWHDDGYYANAASGIVYDAINQMIPVLARRTAQLAEWERAGLPVGWIVEDENELQMIVESQEIVDVAAYKKFQANLSSIRDSLALPALAAQLRSIVTLSP